MLYGTYLGLFWIAKFMLFPLGLIQPLFELLFMLLTIVGPIWVIWTARRFRDTQCNGEITFFSALIFCFQIYLFASILVAIGHYIYFQYIDNGFIYRTLITLFDESVKQAPVLEPIFQNYRNTLDLINELSPIQLTMQLISQNILYGIILSLLTSLICMRRKRTSY